MRAAKLEFPVKNGRAIYDQYKKLSSVALKMRESGWRVNQEAVAKHYKAAKKRQNRFKELWDEITGGVDLGKSGSTAAIKTHFWKTLGLDSKISVDKKSGQPKLDTNGALMHWLTTSDNQVVRDTAAALIGYRKASKTLEFCEEYDVPRVHATFNVTGTKGSRWSCTGPNIQQLPSKEVKYQFSTGVETLAVSLKDILVADEGCILVGADYAALELYLQTYLASAQRLLSWIAEGKDLHIENAHIFYSDLPADASKKTHKKEREVAKLAYGFAYNASDHVGTTAKQMRAKDPDLTDAVVKEMRKRYFAAHPEFPGWQKSIIASIAERGYVEVPPFSRRLYLEDSSRGHNQGLNSGPQILGGDICNAAILDIAAEMDWKRNAIRAQVHDSIVLQVEDTAANRAYWPRRLEKAMAEQNIQVNGVPVRLVAEAAIGKTFQSV